mgnify:CR=1 FL=1
MTSLAGLRIGVIGLGLMGRHMARNLQAAGARLTVHNRSPEPVRQMAEEGMTGAASPAELAAHVGDGVIVLMVTNSDAVRQVIEGPDGILETLAPGALVIDMGTTQVTDTRELAARVTAAGAAYVDAPVSGGEVGARDGNLSIMAGGSLADYDRALPLFEILGRNINRIGEVGAGQVAKTANQMIVGMTLDAVAEALTLAEAAGVDPAKVRDALQGGFAASRVLDLHGGRMVNGDFTPGGRISVQHKDIRQASALADSLGVALPGLARNLEIWTDALDRGLGEQDQAGIINAFRNKPAE